LTAGGTVARIRGSFLTGPVHRPEPQESRSVANIKSAEKRAKQAVRRRAHNMAARSRLRGSIRKVLTAIEAGDRTAATAAYRAAQPVIDTMVNKGIIHRNKAARHKRELNARLKAMTA
jgi:small subunit ribosomal protein S20